MMNLIKKLTETKTVIAARTGLKPTIGIILGSGLDGLTDRLENAVSFRFDELPHFIKDLTAGHEGVITIGTFGGKTVLLMKGRYHYYEGHSLTDITYPIRLMKALGVETLVLSNACGAVNRNFQAGGMMLITDHLNLTGDNPLIGPNQDEFGVRFPDATEIYSQELIRLTKSVASKLEIKLEEGIYAWWSGPSYETPAEIRMIRFMGADAVGMSTVPEALVASHMGMRIVGISCLTNMASGILPQKLSHEEVLIASKQISGDFGRLVRKLIEEL
jgi:purine-nucleoside phosphorylase